ncbi:hypothetical protein [Phycicoccus sp. Soil803]|uniref:hypothetical protein n=1 Tax=Phycicoccus sp. Soil803 TaxID=1736415 RepID=UPI000A81C0E3|nr:hypothetical protein [Phycicoccus sp. Soil803]
MKGRPRLAKACDHLCETFVVSINPSGMRWKPGSSVAARIAAADGELAGVLEEGAVAALLAFDSATDHLRALGQLLNTEVVAPLATVTRGTVEAAAASAYLLDSDASPNEQARRFLNQMFAALTDLKLAPDEVADREGLERTIEEGIGIGMRLGLAVTRPRRNWEPPFLGDRPEHIAARVDRVMLRDDLGKVVYRMLSATAHATPQGLMHYRREVPGGAEGYFASEAKLDDVSIALRHAAAPISVVRAGLSLMRAYGLDTTSVTISAKMALAAWAETAGLEHDAFARVAESHM